MCPATWLAAAGLGLLAAAPADARPRGPRPAENPSWTVKGYGVTAQDAEQQALDQASATVAEFLRRADPALTWVPPGDYLVQRKLATRLSAARAEDLELSGRMYVSEWRVEVTPQLVEEAHERSRHERMAQRHRTLALGLSGVVVTLLIVAGYLRVEEATRGYLTRPLRLGAAAVLTLVVLALLLTLA